VESSEVSPFDVFTCGPAKVKLGDITEGEKPMTETVRPAIFS